MANSSNRMSVRDLDAYAHRLKRIDVEANEACVYFLVRGEEVIYVGQSDNARVRIQGHARDKAFDYALVLPLGFEHPIVGKNAVESAFIRWLKPSMNGPPPTRSTGWDRAIMGAFARAGDVLAHLLESAGLRVKS